MTYKDPCVVHLPDAPDGSPMGWLMLMSRVRVAAGSTIGGNPTDSMSDIVAWWAEEADPYFKESTVTGPYWIAPSIGSLGSGSDGYRLWLSVPGGIALSGDTLAVYFMTEVCSWWMAVDPELDPTTNDPAILDARNDLLDTVFDGILWLDRQRVTTEVLEPFQSAIGVHLIPLQRLRDLKTAGLYDDEGAWGTTASGATYKACEGSGSVKSPAYLWEYDPSGAPASELVNRDGTFKFADPQCASCSVEAQAPNTADARLFLAAIPRDKNSWWESRAPDNNDWYLDDQGTHGLWLAFPVDSTATVTRKDGTREAAVAGVDWMLAATTPFEPGEFKSKLGSLTSLDGSGTTIEARIPLDPDPVAAPDGSYFDVFYGLQEFPGTTAIGSSVVLLGTSRGDHADGCEFGVGEAEAAVAARMGRGKCGCVRLAILAGRSDYGVRIRNWR